MSDSLRALARAEYDAWESYSVATNHQYDHSQACEVCRDRLPTTVQPGSLLAVTMLSCEVAEARAREADAAYTAWQKAHAEHYRAAQERAS